MLLFPDPPAEVRQQLETVIGTALNDVTVAPPWVVIADDGPQWLQLAAVRPPGERARAVVAAMTDAALVSAHHLAIGGAIRLPASTPALALAVESAMQAPVPSSCCFETAVHELVARPRDALAVVTFNNCGFWRWQLGARLLIHRLVDLATQLQTLPALLPLPGLIVDADAVPDLESAWQSVRCSGLSPTQGLRTAKVRQPPRDPALLIAAASEALGEAIGRNEDQASTPASPLPVCALPSGERLGHWAPAQPADSESGKWLALPQPNAIGRSTWFLHHPDGTSSEIEEVVEPEAVAACTGPACRVPGWLSVGLRPGSPAGVLLERLAAAAQRASMPLWVANVDQQALHFLLRLKTTLWVDGPAVPEG